MTVTSRIAVLTVPSDHSWALINALAEQFGPLHVLAEDKQGKWELIRKRIRRQGIVTVMGQIGFVLMQKLVDRRQRGRVAEIVRDTKLDVSPNPACEIYEIGSVNAMACRAALAMIDPAVVVVAGTRIIVRDTLAAITVPIINVHMGWNPAYRGQAGGYWALASGDPDHAGVTVHLVDAGVDTGNILYREKFTATSADSFGTYFYLQAATARALLVEAVKDALAGRLRPYKGEGPSCQHFHPTLWGYFGAVFKRGIW